jgi:hypothetical protein
MQIKENWLKLSQNKRTLYYWGGIFVLADVVIISQHIARYLHSGQCQNILSWSSSLQNCSAFEFIRFGFAGLGFINLAVFAPLVIGMYFITKLVDTIFAKNEER